MPDSVRCIIVTKINKLCPSQCAYNKGETQTSKQAVTM